jgi:hypothetical protein
MCRGLNTNVNSKSDWVPAVPHRLQSRPPRHRLYAERKAILKMDRTPYLSKPRWLARLWARTKSE